MTFRFLSPAQQDLAEIVDYYEGAVAGLGLDVFDSVQRTRANARVADFDRVCRAC